MGNRQRHNSDQKQRSSDWRQDHWGCWNRDSERPGSEPWADEQCYLNSYLFYSNFKH
ncbi:hypothetical protein BCEN4_740168 [Burkholderia cenocepacia]|nr:hypothetical protein BCEN4_740168 [Burkholderia cenocepacia]